jgi:hypothetical protein
LSSIIAIVLQLYLTLNHLASLSFSYENVPSSEVTLGFSLTFSRFQFLNLNSEIGSFQTLSAIDQETLPEE